MRSGQCQPSGMARATVPGRKDHSRIADDKIEAALIGYMLERGALLAGQHQAAFRCPRQRSFPATIFDLMPVAFRQQF